MRKTRIAILVALAFVVSGCVYSPTILVNSEVNVSTSK